MLACDRDALICDLAETYGVFDYRALPVHLLATLASGLREDSRIRRRMSGMKAPLNTLLIASAVDALHLLVWSRTKDGQKGRNRPKSVLDYITGRNHESRTNDTLKFRSAEEFNAAWQRAATTEVNRHGD